MYQSITLRSLKKKLNESNRPKQPTEAECEEVQHIRQQAVMISTEELLQLGEQDQH